MTSAENSNNDPVFSVILATDNYPRVKRVIESLAAQTIAHKVELVLVSTESIDTKQFEAPFHSVTQLRAQAICPLSHARAQGVRAAKAPFVFVAETHAYPDPDLLERLSGALSQEWSLAVPGFRNANPESGLSWAGFLSDYGAWAATLPAGETAHPPSHDAAFRKEVLLQFGDRLEKALTFGDELYVTLQARGQKAYFEPTAGIQHVNLNRFRCFVGERFLSGAMIGAYRGERWGWGKRLVYAAGSPLIPFVLWMRIRKGVKEIAQRQRLPKSAIPSLMFGIILKSAGECRGYLLGMSEKAEEGMTGYEVRKLAFNEGLES
jgi:glycosyltransferase involved in cell wall biosynthesis